MRSKTLHNPAKLCPGECVDYRSALL